MSGGAVLRSFPAGIAGGHRVRVQGNPFNFILPPRVITTAQLAVPLFLEKARGHGPWKRSRELRRSSPSHPSTSKSASRFGFANIASRRAQSLVSQVEVKFSRFRAIQCLSRRDFPRTKAARTRCCCRTTNNNARVGTHLFINASIVWGFRLPKKR